MLTVTRQILVAFFLLATGALLLVGAPRSAQATSGTFDWFGFLTSLTQKSSCQGYAAPNLNAWTTALGSVVPTRDDMILFEMAYPCGSSPTRFLQTRAWKNYYLFDQGVWQSSWEGQPFLSLESSADLLLDAGFWPDGPM